MYRFTLAQDFEHICPEALGKCQKTISPKQRVAILLQFQSKFCNTQHPVYHTVAILVATVADYFSKQKKI